MNTYKTDFNEADTTTRKFPRVVARIIYDVKEEEEKEINRRINNWKHS